MIPKVDFGDYHKFRASVGIVMMAAGPIAAWFFFRQTFDLLIAQSELDNISTLSRWIVFGRQLFQIPASVAVVFGSYKAFRHGLKMFKEGMAGWDKAQATVDETAEINLRVLKSGMRSQTAEETISEVTREIATANEGSEPLKEKREMTFDEKERLGLKVSHFLSLKAMLARKIQTCASPNYEIRSNQNLRNLQYSLVMFAKHPQSLDILIEINNSVDSRLVGYLEDLLPKYCLGAEDFSMDTIKRAHLILAFIRNEHTRMPSDIKEAVTQTVKRLGTALPITVLAVTEREVQGLDCFGVNLALNVEGTEARFWTDEDLA